MRTGFEVDAVRRRQPALRLALAAIIVAACGSRQPAAEPQRPLATETAKGDAVPFIHDDWARALSEAKAKKKPIFVDAWAEWCHSCLSMRAFVLSDRALAPLADDFVWLAIDTEKPENAAFVAKYTNRVYPTLWVIDAAKDEAVMRWEGTATAPELVDLLSASKANDATTLAFVRANHEAARGDLAEAERGYREVLAAPPSHVHRARAAEALAGLFAQKKAWAACAKLATDEHPRLPPGTSRAVVLVQGLECAAEADDRATTAALEKAALEAANDKDPRVIPDDRSALFEAVVDLHAKAKDDAGAKAIATQWAAYLEREAAAAPTKAARAVYDAHRVNAYLALGEPLRAVPMLQESERDAPGDYNPPARLARVYFEAKKLDDAKAAIERAGDRVYGPRSLRVFVLAADIAAARGDRAGERAALERALAKTAQAVLNASQKKLRDTLEKRLAGLAPP